MPSAIVDARGDTRYAYDSSDRVVSVEQPGGAQVGYGYDADGNRTSLTTSAGTAAYQFDGANRLTRVTDPAGGQTTFGYDASGNRTTALRPNADRTLYDYDDRNRVTRVRHEREDGTPIGSFAYTLSPDGLRTKVDELGGRSAEYRYDALDRLVEEDITDPSAGDRDTVYAYDPVGNRTSATRGATTTAYDYDADDKLLHAGGVTFAYDANGNVVQRSEGTDTRTFAYDSANQLVSTGGDGPAAQFRYDAAGNRVRETTGGTSTDYLLDTSGPLARVLGESSSAGGAAQSYVWGDRDLLSRRRGATSSYYLADGLGSTRLLTDSTGAVSDSYSYDAFGGELATTGATANDFRFLGEQFEPRLGTYNLRARHYDPSTGRFTSIDPVMVGQLEQPLTFNRYLYANADPINKMDPSGRQFGMMELGINFASIAFTTVWAIREVQEETLARKPRAGLSSQPAVLRDNTELLDATFDFFYPTLPFPEQYDEGAVELAADMAYDAILMSRLIDILPINPRVSGKLPGGIEWMKQLGKTMVKRVKADKGIYYMARVTTALNYRSKYELLLLGEY
jgi:RHS repeat-associated protein